MSSVRTRFAPSPTGFLHIGGARTALFNFLYAKSQKGKFILRVEDTDQERSTKEAEETILKSLEWLGIKADESPYVTANHGPYRQSERLEIYKNYTNRLLKEKRAYPCFCTDDELQVKQSQAKSLGKPYVYDGKCRNLSQEEIKVKQEAGEKYAIRFHCLSKDIRIEDLVQGLVIFDSRLIGDFIIVKSNGFPSYNYAVVIDDYEMKISHVLRGVGHLSNTPRQILIHEALSFPLPRYAHISEIVGNDRKKLSKRKGATSILLFQNLGYSPQAFVNYMSLLGWYPRDAQEKMTISELQEKFDIQHCSKSPAMFDFFITKEENLGDTTESLENLSKLNIEEIKKNTNQKSKLNWLNNIHMRETELEVLWKEQKLWLEKDKELKVFLEKNEAKAKHAFDCIRKYLYTYRDALPYLKEIFQEKNPNPNLKDSSLDLEKFKEVISEFRKFLEVDKPKTPENFQETMKKVSKITGAKGRDLFLPIRMATTGSKEGLELPLLFSILGWERVQARLALS